VALINLLEPASRINGIPFFAYDCVLVIASFPRLGYTVPLVVLLVDPSTGCVSVALQVGIIGVYSYGRSKRDDGHGRGEQ
jgi:hypothetical protein